MDQNGPACRLTVAKAIVSYHGNQHIEPDGRQVRVLAGGFGIFDRGHVPSLDEAPYEARDYLPLHRGQIEQTRGLASVAYARDKPQRRVMFCTAAAEPGKTSLLTAAALAHANRLLKPLLPGDYFATHRPDPAPGVTDVRPKGVLAEGVSELDDFAAFSRAEVAERTSGILTQVDPDEGWTEVGHACWDVGTAEISARPEIAATHGSIEPGRAKQRRGM